ncbi:sigma-54-dependent Fis family transcriptional regulator [Rhodococcus sp. NPDC057529]|uniref:sigma-54-dependent Fis family transcriptional regulator n=1 Tax=Rhodococcus sp. NPDC057529 TaxID=3346158 RepID=UPI003670AA5E
MADTPRPTNARWSSEISETECGRHGRDLRPEIAASWHRSSLAGLSQDQALDAAICDVDATSRLMQAAAPVLRDLGRQFEGFEVGALLADRSAVLVAGRFGTKSLAREVDRLGAVAGVQFSEVHSGTNAIATPYETRASVFVHQDEHYLASMRGYSCYGSPIISPTTNRVEGVIDVMASAESSPALMKSVIDRAVQDIRNQLLETYDVNVMAVFAAFNSLRRQSTDAVVMISDDIILNNRRSVDILAPEDYVTLRGIALERPGYSGTIELELMSGSAARVKITDMGDPPATVFQVRHSTDTTTVIPRGISRRKPTSRLDRDIAAAARTDGHICIQGEPGSGRSWAAAQVAPGNSANFLDATEVVRTGERAWLDQLDRACATTDTVIVVESIELLPKTLIAHLARALRSDRPYRLVLTCAGEAESASEVSYLASLCAAQVQIPPLRDRVPELGVLVSRIVGDELRAPGVRVTLSAVEALAGHSWPGNLSELVRVLREVVGNRSTGDVTVRDLPEQFRTPGRMKTLPPLKRAERDAIEAAMKLSRGNKVHAAAQLGISRSTLYARIREYGLS